MIRVSMLFWLLSLSLLAGCLTGSNYPAERARTYCASLFSCVAEGEIELLTTYDDVNECVAEERRVFEESSLCVPCLRGFEG